MAKKSFWQRITGAVKVDEYELDEFEEFEDEFEDEDYNDPNKFETEDEYLGEEQILESSPSMELPLDVYHDSDNIYIEAFIPGVKLEDLDIELSREMISIRGSRQASRDLENTEFFTRELEWGDFTRSISLPEEVDIDSSSATESGGVLKIVLPKFNKLRKAKLTVKQAKR